MARGWESKSVEEQQSSGELTSRAPTTQQQQELESLQLQRKRIQSELDLSTNPRFIAQQQKSLDYLDQKLKQLSKFTFQAGQ